MGFNKLISSLIIFSILFCSIVQPTSAMSDLASEGLDIVTEIANSQDAAAGLEKYSKDKYSDWMWQAAGGYENIASGNLLGESYIEQIKGKFDTIQTVLKGISDFALAIDAGRYDEALYHTIETTVNAVDHPLVSVTWSAAKLTYQSHMMVKNTEAERQIAILFHTLHKDRRLFEDESSSMKQIPINTETVDYFFNKYIVTDTGTRAQLKAYVEMRLKEEWPEESWGSWLGSVRTIGTGIDTGQTAETEALTGQYKNTARRWIRRLMEDVNLEAQRWYSEKELRKLMAEFEVFRSEFNTFNADIDGMLKDFLRKKEIEAKAGFYDDFLKQSEKKYIIVANRFEKSKDNKRSLFSELYNEAKGWEMNCVSYRSQVRWAGMKSLADSFLVQIREWTELKDKIYDNMPPVATDPEEAYFETYAEEEYKPLDWEIISAMTAGLLEEPDFIKDRSRAEDLKNEYIEVLTDTSDTRHYQEDNDYFQVKNTLVNINRLNSIVNHDWAGYYNQCNNELNSISGRINDRYNLYKSMIAGGSLPQTDIKPEDEQAVESFDGKAEEAVELAKSGLHWSSALPRLREDASNEEIIDFKLAYVKEAGKNAKEIISEAVIAPASIYLQETDRWFKDRHGLLQQRIEQRNEQYKEIEDYLVRLRSVFTGSSYNYNQDLRKVEALTEAVKPVTPAKWLRESEKWAREESFNSYNGVSAKTIDISDILESDAEKILAEAIGYDYISDLETGYLSFKTQSGSAENIWKKIILPTDEEELEIQQLVDKDFSVDSLKKLESEIRRLSGETELIGGILFNIEGIVNNDYEARLRTADWLQDIAYRMDLLFAELKSSGLIKNTFTLNLPEGYAYIGENAHQREKSEFDGMILTAEPYPHLMQGGEISGLQSEISEIKNKFSDYNVYSFYSNYARNALKTLNNILDLKIISDKPYPPIKAASEDIIVHLAYIIQENTMESLAQAANFAVIKESNLREAEEIVEELVDIVGGEVNENYRLKEEKKFIDYIRSISEILPLTVEINIYPASKDTPLGGRVSLNDKGEKVQAEIKYIIKDEALDYLKEYPEEYPVVKRYKQILLDLKEVIYKYHHRAEEELKKESARQNLYDMLAYKIEDAIKSVEFFISEKDYENALLYEEKLEELSSENSALPGEEPGSRCPELLEKLEKLIKEAEDLIGREDEEFKEILNQVREFYDLFTGRYQSRDEYGVLSLLADEWEAADGTTLWDLEDTLIRNFRVFDNISYQITNLEIVENKGNGQYLVNYQLKIVSEIFERNIRHQEISSVREIVEIKENGTGQILRTLGGRFWQE